MMVPPISEEFLLLNTQHISSESPESEGLHFKQEGQKLNVSFPLIFCWQEFGQMSIDVSMGGWEIVSPVGKAGAQLKLLNF